MNFSIIIPTLNRSTLPKVLQSLVNNFQANKNSAGEIIIIFDGEQQKFISPILPKIDNLKFKILFTGKNSGASVARNLGINSASNKITIFLGDDIFPGKNWLTEIIKFHTKFPQKNYALLGKVTWIKKFKKQQFYQWLDKNMQFRFGDLAVNKEASWKYFYTANISLKTTLLQSEKFSEKFSGWGFEDIELGYRLFKKYQMKLFYSEKSSAEHDHSQVPENIKSKTIQARKNAKIMENLHPEIKILPTGFRRKILQIIIFCGEKFPWKTQQMKWWLIWKKAWINY